MDRLLGDIDAVNIIAGILLGSALTLLGRLSLNALRCIWEQKLRSVTRVDVGSRSGGKTFRAATEVYNRLPQEMRDSPEEIAAWLRETARTELWQEIYLVSRNLLQGVNGVLYASLYPFYSCGRYQGPMCVVNALVARTGLALDKALTIEKKLWGRLQHEVRKHTGKPGTPSHYFFEVLDPSEPPPGGTISSEDEQERRREYLKLLSKIGAQHVAVNYRLPDLEECRTDQETPAKLYHLGPTGTDDEHSALNFIYGFHYFWEFKFGEDLTETDELAARLRYIRGLIRRTSPSVALPLATD